MIKIRLVSWSKKVVWEGEIGARLPGAIVYKDSLYEKHGDSFGIYDYVEVTHVMRLG